MSSLYESTSCFYFNENIKKMEEWIREGGGSTSGLEVRFVSDVYRGVFLRDNAKVKYFYLNNLERKNSKFDPTWLFNHLWTSWNIRNVAESGETWIKIHVKFTFLKDFKRAPKHTKLALFLIQERRLGENSFWKYYLRSLPSNMDSMPLFYTDEEKALLKGSPALPVLEKRIQEN